MIPSPLWLTVGLLLCAGAMALLLLVVLRPRYSRIPLSRRRPETYTSESRLNRLTNTAVTAIDRAIGDRERAVVSRSAIEEAGLKIPRADFILIVSALSVVVALVGLLLNGIVLSLLFALLTPGAAGLYLSFLAGKRRRKFDEQMSDSLQMMAGGLRAGHSIMRAIDAVSQESDSPTKEEFARIVNESRLGRDLGHALLDTAGRMRNEDFSWMAQAIEINREVGGDLAEVLDHVGETIRERSQIKRQIASLSAEGRMSALILGGLPIVMLLILSLLNPGYISPLLHDPIGWLMLASGVILLSIGSLWLRKIVAIKF